MRKGLMSKNCFNEVDGACDRRREGGRESEIRDS